MRDISAAAKTLMAAGDKTLGVIAAHDPDAIRDVAAALVGKAERPHNEDCELRGGGPCYCDAWRPIETVPDDEAVLLATEGGWVGQASKSFQYPREDELHWCWAGANEPLHPTLKPLAWMPLPKFSKQPIT